MTTNRDVRVLKLKNSCASCGKEFVYYRMEFQRGRAPTNCSKQCISESFQKRFVTDREIVPFNVVPSEWQKILLKKAKMFKFNIIDAPGAIHGEIKQRDHQG